MKKLIALSLVLASATSASSSVANASLDLSALLPWSIENRGDDFWRTGIRGNPEATINILSLWKQNVDCRPGVTVAIIDTGVQVSHPVLQHAIEVRSGANILNGSDQIEDDHGHGTHLAGIIAGAPVAGLPGDSVENGNKPFRGICPQAKIIPIKAFDHQDTAYNSDLVKAIYFAIDSGAQIINASWGNPGEYEPLRDAIAEAGKRGILFVTSSGNEGENIDGTSRQYPANFRLPNMMTVASTLNVDKLSGESNYGVPSVDIAAPGDHIYSTHLKSGFKMMSGTSMAVPHVVGALAFLKSNFPGTDLMILKAVLMNTARPLPSLKDTVVSKGVLDLGSAYECLSSGRAPECRR